MQKELRSQTDGFIAYNIEFRRLSEESIKEKREKDIVSFWIHHINFELYMMETAGNSCLDSSKISYGLDLKKLDLKELTSEEFEEILSYYWKKGYILNYYDNIIVDNPEVIIIDWSNPNRQTLQDKIYILKFNYSKLKKFFSTNKLKHSFAKSIILTIKDYYVYYWNNHTYCMNAMRLYKKTLKSKRVIERRIKIRNFVNKISHLL